MKKDSKKIVIIFSIVAGVLVMSFLLPVVLIGIIWGGLNLDKVKLYPDYYSVKTDVCTNPGLNDGFVCQGIAAYEEDGKFFVSGYMKDETPSRIYVTDTDNNSYYVNISYANGDVFTGHAGGITVCNGTVYLADDACVHLLSLTDLINAKNGDTLPIYATFPVNNEASFIYSDDSYIYVGEFHDGKNYITDHPYETGDGMYYAIVSRYRAEDMVAYDDGSGKLSAQPDKIYSIRNKVQGICFTPNGKVVMSTSYGIADSEYFIYDESDAVDSGKTLDGAPVFYLDSHKKSIKGPAMAEGLDFYDGKIITLTESASDKYIFGKFFFADKIVALDITK